MTREGKGRERMVAAALDLISERGYGNVTMLDVTERAGTPRGSMYHHFPGGKEALAIEVAAQARADAIDRVARIRTESSGPQAFLEAIIQHHSDSVTGSDFALGCPMMGILANVPPEATSLHSAASEALAAWVDAIAEGLASNGVRRPAAKRIASAIVAAVEGAIVLSRASRSSAPFSDVSAWVPALLADGADSAPE
jgi:TetR/AcrR family transcriptional repressor of lmrAB and yxaGH operons